MTRKPISKRPKAKEKEEHPSKEMEPELDISTLFSKDPKKVTDKEFKQLLEYVRAERKSFAQGKRSSPDKAAVAESKEKAANISLTDILGS